MATLKEKYTDIRGRTHSVEHAVVSTGDKATREQIVEELFYALTKSEKSASADVPSKV